MEEQEDASIEEQGTPHNKADKECVYQPELGNSGRTRSTTTGEDFNVLSTDEQRLATCGINTQTITLLKQLGMVKYYPSGIKMEHIMCRPVEDEGFGWTMLTKLLMIDYRGRHEVSNYKGSEDTTTENLDTKEDFIDEIFAEFENPGTLEKFNPLDTFLALFSCCHLLLKQALLKKMHICKLAIPLLYPSLGDGLPIYFSEWALGTTTLEAINSERGETLEVSADTHPTIIVSFVRLGRPSISKSRLLNKIMNNNDHATFVTQDCKNGTVERICSDGLIEGSWYLPSVNSNETLRDSILFLNLRGDASKHTKQLCFIAHVSPIMVVFVEIAHLKTLSGDFVSLLRKHKKVILVFIGDIDKTSLRVNVTQLCDLVGKTTFQKIKRVWEHTSGKKKNVEDMSKEIKLSISELVSESQAQGIHEISAMEFPFPLQLDSEDPECHKGITEAQKILDLVIQVSPSHWKKQNLQLQGYLWHDWTMHQKDISKANISKGENPETFEERSRNTQKEMRNIREKQLQLLEDLSPAVKLFINILCEESDNGDVLLYFLQWLKIGLDKKSREVLPELQKEYFGKWEQFNNANKSKEASDEVKKKQSEMQDADQNLASASLGVENFWRELGQIYEAVQSNVIVVDEHLLHKVSLLPNIAAKLILKGYPIEIIDGDAGGIPLDWLKAVFKSLQMLAPKEKIMVLSILGIQSSGKSTLLNTMFGLDVAVSAGRCTKGVFAQLIKVGGKVHLPYDYILVIDTEGLRARRQLTQGHNRDNELATFVVGLGDITLMNIKGENTAEVSDVLQIIVHGFLRMRLVQTHIALKHSCLFIHQNVPAPDANSKLLQDHQKFQEQLDQMTCEAADQENMPSITSFQQVIDFDCQSYVRYLSDLWQGDPPMAPANTGYSEKVASLKDFLLYDISKHPGKDVYLTMTNIIDRIEDLWEGIVSDNFVFNFKNSLQAKAYRVLESKYCKLKLSLQRFKMEWVQRNAEKRINMCNDESALEDCVKDLLVEFEKESSEMWIELLQELDAYFEKSDLKELILEWKESRMIGWNEEKRKIHELGKNDIYHLRGKQETILKHKMNKETHVIYLTKKAKCLAEEKRGTVSPEEARKVFEVFWNDYLSKMNIHKSDNVPCMVEETEQLIDRRLADYSGLVRTELAKHPLSSKPNRDTLTGSFTWEDIPHNSLSPQRSIFTKFKGFIKNTEPLLHGVQPSFVKYSSENASYMNDGARDYPQVQVDLDLSEDQRKDLYKKAAEEVNAVFRTVDEYVNNICREMTSLKPDYLREVIEKVTDWVEVHNRGERSKPKFTILANLKVKIVVHACSFALYKLQMAEKEYNRKYGIAAQVESDREKIWHLFKNTLEQAKQEKIAADLVVYTISPLMLPTANKEVCLEVVQSVKENLESKHHLIKQILKDLANNGEFQSFISYIHGPREFALVWIKLYVDNYLFSEATQGISRYANMVRKAIQSMIQHTKSSISFALGECIKADAHDMNRWVRKFYQKLSEKICISESDLCELENHPIDDTKFFEECIRHNLDLLEYETQELVKDLNKHTINWSDLDPYGDICDELWGCKACCPLCNEPCIESNEDHLENSKHTCLQHRPTGLVGRYRVKDKSLCTESCSYAIKVGSSVLCGEWSNCPKQCMEKIPPRTPKYHRMKNYMKYMPDWQIDPVNTDDKCAYWAWFAKQHQPELHGYFPDRKFNHIPESWKSITKERALDSLNRYC